MANKNYQRGVGKEKIVKKKFVLMGWTVLRSAGSHGFADLTAIDYINKVIKFIQCKPNRFSEFQKNKLIKENEKYTGAFSVEFEVI